MNKSKALAVDLIESNHPFIYELATAYNVAIDQIHSNGWFINLLADYIWENGNRIS